MDNIMNSNLTRTVLTLSQFAAQKLLHYGFDLAQERQVNLSIALVDHSGVLLAFGRMDEAPVVTVDVAITSSIRESCSMAGGRPLLKASNTGSIRKCRKPCSRSCCMSDDAIGKLK